MGYLPGGIDGETQITREEAFANIQSTLPELLTPGTTTGDDIRSSDDFRMRPLHFAEDIASLGCVRHYDNGFDRTFLHLRTFDARRVDGTPSIETQLTYEDALAHPGLYAVQYTDHQKDPRFADFDMRDPELSIVLRGANNPFLMVRFNEAGEFQFGRYGSSTYRPPEIKQKYPDRLLAMIMEMQGDSSTNPVILGLDMSTPSVMGVQIAPVAGAQPETLILPRLVTPNFPSDNTSII